MFGRKKNKETLDNGLPAPGQVNVAPVASTLPALGTGAPTPGPSADAAGTSSQSTPAPAQQGPAPSGAYPGAWPDGTVIDLRGNHELRNDMIKAMMGFDTPGGSAQLQTVINEAMQAAEAFSQSAMAAVPEQQQPAEDPLDKLQKLNELRHSGALTDAEFDAMKKKLLGET